MSEKRFCVQPDWLDFSIFWALIVSGVALAVIVQMEIVGYGIPHPLPTVMLVLVLVLAVAQLQRARLIVGPDRITVRRLSPANTLHFAPADLQAVTTTRNTISLTTRQYGCIKLVRLGRVAPLEAALESALGGVSPRKGASHV
ncbi:EbsA family protein [Lacticaseibacillus parakribbianus]|uniref:EbsA family protein n=1 Tax=Lacticaseibacillus parakribbianus TaxID=2970927 RepID=UPI0021CB2B67